MRILSIDPGDKTGLASVDSENLSTFESWEINDIDTMLECVDFELQQRHYDLLIVENFIIHADTCKKKKPKRWPLEMVGALRWIARVNGVKLVIQTPSQKDWMDDDKLKRIGWYKGSSTKLDTEGHSDDAARHIGVYLGVTRQEQDFLRRVI